LNDLRREQRGHVIDLLAEAFALLQAKRLQADCDPGFRPTASEARQWLLVAEGALANIAADFPNKDLLLASLVSARR
jgi:hypothetical protein